MKGMEQPKPTPVPSDLLTCYIQAGELQFNKELLQAHLSAVNQKIQDLRARHQIAQEALSGGKSKEAPGDSLPAVPGSS